MYLLRMIKARIRWCTCRVENILTLGKLLSLWFCFLLHSILFLISQTSYRTYKIISSYELARPIMGTIFLVPYRAVCRNSAKGGRTCLILKRGWGPSLASSVRGNTGRQCGPPLMPYEDCYRGTRRTL